MSDKQEEISVTGIILAGGVSKRLGYRNKPLLKIGNVSIIDRVISALAQVLENIILIANSPEEFMYLGLPIFGDIIPKAGPLGGIYTGLKNSRTHYNLIVACDLPFIQPCLLKYLINNCIDYDIAIPVTPDGHHPTCAIYSQNCIKPIEKQIKSGDLKVSNFFRHVKVNRLNISPPYTNHDLRMLFNINTEEDYQKALSMDVQTSNQIGTKAKKKEVGLTAEAQRTQRRRKREDLGITTEEKVCREKNKRE